MQNNYELQQDFCFVFSLARTSTTFAPPPEVAVYCVRERNASKSGSRNLHKTKIATFEVEFRLR